MYPRRNSPSHPRPPGYDFQQDDSNHSIQGVLSVRSPLQKLESKLDHISKEEKRARIHRAESRTRQAVSANQSRRIDTTVQLSLPSHQNPGSGYRRHERRHSSAPLVSPDITQLTHRQRSSSAHMSEAVDPYILHASTKFRRASDILKMQDPSHLKSTNQHQATSQNVNNQQTPTRSDSQSYRHRARDAGFAGAAAAVAAVIPFSAQTPAHNRNSITDDSRRSSAQHARTQPQVGPEDLERRYSSSQSRPTMHEIPSPPPASQHQLHVDRVGAGERITATYKHSDPDYVPSASVKTDYKYRPTYSIPPQAAGGQTTRDHVSFDNVKSTYPSQSARPGEHHQHGFSKLFHHHHHKDGRYRRRPELEEWRHAGVARMTTDDLDVQDTGRGGVDRNGRDSQRSSSTSKGPGAYDGHYDEPAKTFRPPLYLECGPLLRYTGMRREKLAQISRAGHTYREIWRGSVMIVTQDLHSSYGVTPTLRLFAQPMELLPPPSTEHGQDLPVEYLDPIAGQIKVSRLGQPLYVRSVHDLEDGVDISRVENDSGLFERKSPASLHPRRMDDATHQQRDTRSRPYIRTRDGETTGKYREVKAIRLHQERGVTFWRFNLEIELGSAQARVAYRINKGPAIGFWVPARDQSMNIMFHSCNGFSLSVNSNEFTGPDPLWRDVLNKHLSRPFHVMLGGGDQQYSDAVMRDTVHFKEWLQTKNPEHKHRAEFSEEMQDELETFYLDRYSMWFSQGLFGMANSQIPMINIWDDHDIIDGFGSYPHHFMSTKVFTGLGAVAFKYYMLFQHQSVVSETHREEPSWVLGAYPGPYINELSRSVFIFLGRKIALLGLDCRTERMRDEVLSQQSYDVIFERCQSEIIKGETKHLIVLLGIPIAYPRLNFLENILTSRVMDPIKAIGRTGLLGGFVNKFDGGVEILDDLDDHWTAKHHKLERNWFIQELQELAANKSVRITILGGDVHLGAVGQFYSKKKLGIPKDRDHRYMPNVVSSAIVNTPPPNIMGDVLNKRNKTHHLDAETDEDMIPMFEHDVNGKARNNLHLLPRRNYCIIREYIPGSTPPPSPGPQHQLSRSSDDAEDRRQYSPGTIGNKGKFRPGNLVRRLSSSYTKGHQPSVERAEMTPVDVYGPDQAQHVNLPRNDGGSYFPPTAPRPTSTFRRRTTDFSEKAALKASAKGGPEGENSGHINLEYGLDICLNMEVDQKDPAGITKPYRLLVPALWYEGAADINTSRFKSRGASMMDRLRGKSVHRSPSLDEKSLRSGDSRRSSRSIEDQSSRRLDHRNQTSRYEPSGHEPSHARGKHYPQGPDGSSETREFSKEVGPPPPRQRHPALAGAQHYKAVEAAAGLPNRPHPSKSHTRAGITEQPRSLFENQRQLGAPVPYREGDDYTTSEDSLDESEMDEDHYQQQQRGQRPSMADRIFGRVGAQNYEVDQQVDEQSVKRQEATKKPGWRIWKS